MDPVAEGERRKCEQPIPEVPLHQIPVDGQLPDGGLTGEWKHCSPKIGWSYLPQTQASRVIVVLLTYLCCWEAAGQPVGMTLNSSVVVQGMTVKLLPCLQFCTFGRVNEDVLGRTPPAGKGVGILLSWHDSHFWVCITFCKVWRGDSVTEPDYY